MVSGPVTIDDHRMSCSLVVADSTLRFSGGGEIATRDGDAVLFVPAAPAILMAWSRRMVSEEKINGL